MFSNVNNDNEINVKDLKCFLVFRICLDVSVKKK